MMNKLVLLAKEWIVVVKNKVDEKSRVIINKVKKSYYRKLADQVIELQTISTDK